MSGVPNALLVGVGEYTTGFVHGAASNSDKAAGIIALSVFDLRRRGLVGPTIGICGTSGTKLPAVRAHMAKCIGDRYKMDVTCRTYPADDVASDSKAYVRAMDDFGAGDVVIITTPDQTHCTIALEAVNRGMHVMIAKPIVKTVDEHRQLLDAATKRNVMVVGEFHKRWDPMYHDAYNRVRSGVLGDFTFFYAYMSQPKSQLSTFASWVTDKRNSDISYYLNAHHIDFLCLALEHMARPTTVVGMASSGMANRYLQEKNGPAERAYDVEDSITLTVTFAKLDGSGAQGVASFTASWTAPKSDVHSQQRFHFLGHAGEINIDQAHRGYTTSTDAAGYASNNPLFFRYQPDSRGHFAGQQCYGYLSFAHFVDAVTRVRGGEAVSEVTRDSELALLGSTPCQYVTAILEAGRKSLDAGGKRVSIEYQGADVHALRVLE